MQLKTDYILLVGVVDHSIQVRRQSPLFYFQLEAIYSYILMIKLSLKRPTNSINSAKKFLLFDSTCP